MLDRRQFPVSGDLSGIIGLGSREFLLQELATPTRNAPSWRWSEGRMMLDAARQRALSAGVAQPECRQRHGDLVETLRDLQNDTRLLVIGRR